jgi:hypothetical protein
VWRVQDDELVQKLGMLARKCPGDDAAPVVPRDVRAAIPGRMDERDNIRDKMAQVVGMPLAGPVRQVIAAHVGRQQ